jgi:hypothetical protein
MDLIFASGLNLSPDPDCVQQAIAAAAGALGLNITGFILSVQIVGTANPNGGTYGETELNLTGTPAAVTSLNAQLCGLNFYSNNMCPSNNTWLVGAPHTISTGPSAGTPFTGNFRSPGLTNSLQVNTSVSAGTAQIDVDPYNPAPDSPWGLLLHGLLQVIPNQITGSDNTYGCMH